MTVLAALRKVTEDIVSWAKKKIVNQAVVANSTDGVAYTATVPGIESLDIGVSFIMIPGRVSNSTKPTLDVNGLGEKGIRRRLSNLPTSIQTGYNASWLTANKPFRVIYDGTVWIVEGCAKPNASDLSGSIASATKATQDGNGNNIASTYATKTELSNSTLKWGSF